jgi:hypothetical protein
MAFDDLPLERTSPPSPRALHDRRPSPTRWIVAIAAVLVAGAALALWWTVRERPEPATPAPTPATTTAVASHRRPLPQPVELPSLDASDETVRHLAAALSHHPLFVRLLATKDLMRSTALVVQQIADGRTPADPLTVLRPTSRLQILGEESGRIDPASYARWTPATQALTSVDPRDAAQLYVNVKGLLDDAYKDLGHPDPDFDQAIVPAAQMLLATPDAPADEELLRRPSYFEHADPQLRALRPVQKQYLLIGPDNRHRINDWLRAFAADLDLKIS